MNNTKVMDNLITLLNLSHYSDLARILGMSRGRLSYFKQNNTLPYAEIVELCRKKRLSLDLVFEMPIAPHAVDTTDVKLAKMLNLMQDLLLIAMETDRKVEPVQIMRMIKSLDNQQLLT